MKRYELDSQVAAQTLSDILDRCDLERNTIPLDTLLSYSNYRKEKYAVQRRTVLGMMLLFAILPFCFFSLTMSVSKKESQYLTLYELKVQNYFPIQKMSATISGNEMSIFETSDKNYVIKATQNGTMIVTVQLWNQQYRQTTVKVTECDDKAPVLDSYTKKDGEIYIYVSENKSGIKYDGIYVLQEDGTKSKPISIDKENNCIVFKNEKSEVYIPDNAGNKLHITLK